VKGNTQDKAEQGHPGFSDSLVFVDESGGPTLKDIAPHFPLLVLAFLIVKKSDFRQWLIPRLPALPRHVGISPKPNRGDALDPIFYEKAGGLEAAASRRGAGWQPRCHPGPLTC